MCPCLLVRQENRKAPLDSDELQRDGVLTDSGPEDGSLTPAALDGSTHAVAAWLTSARTGSGKKNRVDDTADRVLRHLRTLNVEL